MQHGATTLKRFAQLKQTTHPHRREARAPSFKRHGIRSGCWDRLRKGDPHTKIYAQSDIVGPTIGHLRTHGVVTRKGRTLLLDARQNSTTASERHLRRAKWWQRGRPLPAAHTTRQHVVATDGGVHIVLRRDSKSMNLANTTPAAEAADSQEVGLG